MASHGQRAGDRAHGHGRARDRSVRGDEAALHVSVRVRRGEPVGRGGGSGRAHVPHVPSGNRRRAARAQPGGYLRSPCNRARLAGALHGHPLSVGQVRLLPRTRLPVRRHGARRRHLLQRVLAAAGRIGHEEPAARPRQPHRPRDRPHVVRRSGDDALVRRCMDEGGLRELHGREDREPVVPRGQSRPALPLRAPSRRVRRRSDRGNAPDSTAARQPERSRHALRRHHLSEGAGRDAAARAAGWRAGAS